MDLGDYHVCGLRLGATGGAVCADMSGRVADAVPEGAFSEVTSGDEFSCGLMTDNGGVSCWGGLRAVVGSTPAGAFSAVDAGARHVCALDADGAAVCWGANDYGQADPPPNTAFIAIGAGGAHSCGIAEFGNLVCWGANDYGQADPNDGPFDALALGDSHACALRPSGAAFCQGDGYGGRSQPALTRFSQISAGYRQTCGIADGAVECWGAKPVLDASAVFESVSVGRWETCALRADGSAKCWAHFNVSPLLRHLDRPFRLDNPVEMFAMPSGGTAVVEREGYISVHYSGDSPRIALDLTERTRCCLVEQGMLSAALDPRFDEFPFIYIYWHVDVEDKIEGVDSHAGLLSRFPVAADGRVSADDELVILRLPQEGAVHFGGAVRFGPDGMLYLGLGEFGEWDVEDFAASPRIHPSAQDLNTLAGKIIRLDVRGATESEPYRIPSDNPFVDAPGARPEIYAYGLRNPWRMSFKPGGELLVADVGSRSREEVSEVAAGANMGWPVFEGAWRRLSEQEGSAPGAVPPLVDYDHSNGDCAIIGGAHMPGADGGKYVFGDYCSGRVWTLEGDAQTGRFMREAMDLPLPILAFGTDADGALYALAQGGAAFPVAVAE